MRLSNDARTGEAVVESAMIAAEERGQETEAGRCGEHQPYQRAEKRAANIERRVRIGRHDANARRHLAKRLTASGERDEITAILHEQERQERRLRQHVDFVE